MEYKTYTKTRPTDMSIIYRYGTSIESAEQPGLRRNRTSSDFARRYTPPGSRVYDPCDMCDAANITESCNKCCRGVCDDNICSLKFPDRGETTFIVCATCVEEINKKLIPLIDLGKLRLLKKTISTNRTSRSPRSSSVSSTSTISSDEGSIYGGLTMSR
jgi:hypothetical protein